MGKTFVIGKKEQNKNKQKIFHQTMIFFNDVFVLVNVALDIKGKKTTLYLL